MAKKELENKLEHDLFNLEKDENKNLGNFVNLFVETFLDKTFFRIFFTLVVVFLFLILFLIITNTNI